MVCERNPQRLEGWQMNLNINSAGMVDVGIIAVRDLAEVIVEERDGR